VGQACGCNGEQYKTLFTFHGNGKPYSEDPEPPRLIMAVVGRKEDQAVSDDTAHAYKNYEEKNEARAGHLLLHNPIRHGP